MAGERFRVEEHLEETERVHRLRLPLQCERLDGLDPNGIAHEQPRLGADQCLARGSCLLEACGDVDRVAGDERLALAADDDLAGVDADPRLEAVLGDRRPHLRRGANSTQCVVLVRRPESRRRP